MSNTGGQPHQSIVGYGIAAAGLMLIIFAVVGDSNSSPQARRTAERQGVQRPPTAPDVPSAGSPSSAPEATVSVWQGAFSGTFSGTAEEDGSWMEVTRKLTVGRSAINFQQLSRAGAADPAVGTVTAAIRCRNPIVELSASTVAAGVSARCYLSIAARAGVSLWSDSVALTPRNGFSRFEFDGLSQTWSTTDGEGSLVTLRRTN